MTVFHVLPQFYFVNERTIIGGYPSAVARLAVAQAAQGSSVEIVSRMPEMATSQFGDVRLSNLEVLSATSHRRPLHFTRELLGFLRPRVRAEDSIHVHSGHAEYALISAVMGLILGVRVLHTLYCPLRPGMRGLAQRLAIMLGRASGVAFSGMSRNVCKSIPGPSTWTPPVIDSHYFDPGVNAPDEGQILFVGNATPSKGLADLLPAFVDLVKNSEHGERMRLVVTTELARTSERSEMRDVVDDLKGAVAMSQISWLSIVSDMRDLLSRSAIHVAPFRTTNGPSDYFISTLEAMSMGKVCVVSDLPGMAEVVREGETGFCFRSGDSLDLQRALSRAMECDRIALGERARNFVIENFGAAAVKTTNTLYGDFNA
jgi:glycosyltransferase involved in cell wall biosynthesis